MNTPPVLRPYETLVESLKLAATANSIMVGERIDVIGGRDATLSALDGLLTGRHAVPVPGIQTPGGTPVQQGSTSNGEENRIPVTPERLRTVVYGIQKGLEDCNLLIWRGDLFDAAAQDWEMFEGTHPTPDMLPEQPELWLFDADGPQSNTKTMLEGFCASQFELPKGRLALRAISVTDVLGLTTRLMQRFKNDPPAKWETLVQHTTGQSVQEMIASMEASAKSNAILGVTLFLRDRTERGDDTKNIPYIVDAQIGIGSKALHPIALLCLACIDFTKQPFTEKSENPYPRWKRSTGGKPSPQSPPSPSLSVNRLVLRRADKDVAEGEAGDGKKRTYSSQWIVRAHRRKLHEPRKADGKQVIWVSGYVKGNPEAPLKSSVNVAHVKR